MVVEPQGGGLLRIGVLVDSGVRLGRLEGDVAGAMPAVAGEPRLGRAVGAGVSLAAVQVGNRRDRAGVRCFRTTESWGSWFTYLTAVAVPRWASMVRPGYDGSPAPTAYPHR
jgi:hypothetical protein